MDENNTGVVRRQKSNIGINLNLCDAICDIIFVKIKDDISTVMEEYALLDEFLFNLSNEDFNTK